jgi:hypothetical protein
MTFENQFGILPQFSSLQAQTKEHQMKGNCLKTWPLPTNFAKLLMP